MRLKHFIRPQSSLRCSCAPAVVLGAMALACAPAQADEGDVLRPYVGASITHDDNILAATDVAMAFPALDPRHVDKRSNLTHRVEAGLIVDKNIGLQKLTANLNLNRTRFSEFGNLDYTGQDLAANWNWHVGTHIDGNIGVTHVRNLAGLDEYHLPDPHMRNQDRQYLDAGWLFHPSWKVYGGLSHYRLTYDIAAAAPVTVQAALRNAERTIDDITVGSDYLARSGSSVGLQYRHARGRLESAVNSYEQDEVKGKIDWKFSGKTDLQFLGGWVRWKDSAGNTFRGVNARLNAIWRVTKKITLDGNLFREVSAVDELYAAYALSDGLELRVNWDMLEKIKLDAEFRWQDRDYSISGNARQDTYHYGGLTLTYLPTRNWRLLMKLYRSQRESNLGIGTYRNNGASVGTRLEF